MTREDIVKAVGSNEYIDPQAAGAYYDYLSLLPKYGSMIEIGTGFGHSTRVFAKIKPDWSIYTIDGYGLYGEKSLFDKGAINRKQLQINITTLPKNVVQIVGNSRDIRWKFPINALYIDGDHTYKYCRSDFYHYSKFVVRGGIIMFDDYWREDFGVAKVVSEVVDDVNFKLVYCERVAILKVI